jgi:hypothetical protein
LEINDKNKEKKLNEKKDDIIQNEFNAKLLSF